MLEATHQSRPPVSVVRIIRRVRGGSQAALVECDDHHLYIIKFNNNPQGPNLLANEWLASCLAKEVGLRVAETKVLTVTQSFLDQNPSIFLETTNHKYRPQPGTHLGCSFIESADELSRPTEWLRTSDAGKVANRSEFLGMYLFDVWALQQDNRQAIFVPFGRMLHGIFIDNGHLFGGPYWKETPRRYTACHINRLLYDGLWNKRTVKAWISLFQDKIPRALSSVCPLIPLDWYSGDLTAMRECLLQRLVQLPQIAEEHSLDQRPGSSVPKLQEMLTPSKWATR